MPASSGSSFLLHNSEKCLLVNKCGRKQRRAAFTPFNSWSDAGFVLTADKLTDEIISQ